MNTQDDSSAQKSEVDAAKRSRAAGAAQMFRSGVLMAAKLAGRLMLYAGRAALRGLMIALRAVGKFSITTWRLASALDSALWRAVKLLARRLFDAFLHALALIAQVLKYVVLWLPTRTGRAYSALSGVAIVVCGLWIADLLRENDGVAVVGARANRPPIDEEDPILARIGGRFVHLSEITAAAQAGGVMRPDEGLTPERAFERGLVESYVEQRLLARAARDDGLHRTPSVLRRVNTARDRILAASLIKSRVDEEITPEIIERYYREQRKIMQIGDEVRARHILVETEEAANDVIAALTAGGDFAQLARERSRDRATAPLGGEIGWFSRGVMARNFANVAFRTPVGELSAPFQTEYGWHIIEVSGRRPTSAKSLAEVENEIEEFLRNEIIAGLLSDLVDENRVVYYRPETEPSPAIAPLILPPEIGDEKPELREQADG